MSRASAAEAQILAREALESAIENTHLFVVITVDPEGRSRTITNCPTAEASALCAFLHDTADELRNKNMN